MLRNMRAHVRHGRDFAYVLDTDDGTWIGAGVRRRVGWRRGRVSIAEPGAAPLELFPADLCEFGRFLETCGPVVGSFAFEASADVPGDRRGDACASFVVPEVEALCPARPTATLETPTAGALRTYRQLWRDDVSRDAYVQRVRRAQVALRRGEAQKVILARGLSRPWPHGLDPLDLVRAFRAFGPEAGYGLLLTDQEHTIAGLSPEPVLRYGGGRLATTILAGTHAAGFGAAEDRRLREALVANPKERREHQLAVEEAERLLSTGCGAVARRCGDAMRPLRRGPVMHLATDIEAPWRAVRHLGDVLTALLPAITVSGVPRRESLALIATLEERPRGLYAGAVGRLDGQREGTLLLAIRCAMKRMARLELRSGAGILPESDPQAEWEETERKLLLPLAAVQSWEDIRC